MPYIPQADRDDLYVAPPRRAATAGELNYQLTRTVLAYLGDAPRYENFNAAIGALEACKLELYRRMVAPYEDGKIREQGDVYPGAS